MSAALDTNTYPTGVRIGDAEMAALPLTRHVFHGDWNHALHPQPRPAAPTARAPQAPAPQWDLGTAVRSSPEAACPGNNRMHSQGLWPWTAIWGAAVRPGSPSPNRSWRPYSICDSPWPRNLSPCCSAAAGPRCTAPPEEQETPRGTRHHHPTRDDATHRPRRPQSSVLAQTSEPRNEIKTTFNDLQALRGGPCGP
ncbi:hypothetical protein [Streptomyces sp. SAI-127]|uniref:hypothetical protein n=1 Tax=Streptomyces sp. SAI-127 TaxID=2940543 RepID=UPI002473845A|nr:hypothetical protein [Streptomyces sp. SAI-127]